MDDYDEIQNCNGLKYSPFEKKLQLLTHYVFYRDQNIG